MLGFDALGTTPLAGLIQEALGQAYYISSEPGARIDSAGTTIATNPALTVASVPNMVALAFVGSFDGVDPTSTAANAAAMTQAGATNNLGFGFLNARASSWYILDATLDAGAVSIVNTSPSTEFAGIIGASYSGVVQSAISAAATQNGSFEEASGNAAITVATAAGDLVVAHLWVKGSSSIVIGIPTTSSSNAITVRESISINAGRMVLVEVVASGTSTVITVPITTPAGFTAWRLESFILQAAGATAATTASAAAGVASVSAVGAAMAATAATAAAGQASVSAVGAASAASIASAATGTASVSAVGAATAAADGSATGTSTVGAVGSSTAAAAATAADGAATVSAAGASTTAADATPAAGVATVSGGGSTVSDSSADAVAAAGAATVSAVGSSTAAATATAFGAATAGAAGSSTAATVATAAAGSASVSASGSRIEPSSATAAAGVATVSAVGASSAASAVTAAAGLAIVSGVGSATAAATATPAAGVATVQGATAILGIIAATAVPAAGMAIVAAVGSNATPIVFAAHELPRARFRAWRASRPPQISSAIRPAQITRGRAPQTSSQNRRN